MGEGGGCVEGEVHRRMCMVCMCVCVWRVCVCVCVRVGMCVCVWTCKEFEWDVYQSVN